jgi:hypothetical protein
MTIRIELQEQVYQQNFDNLLRGSRSETLGSFKGVPTGNFTQIDGPLTQFSIVETPFRITTDNPGEIHTIRAELISNETQTNVLKVRNRVVEKQFIPVNDVVTVSIALLKGENQITVSTVNDSSFTAVISSYAGTFLTTYAREIFNSTQNPLDEQDRALFSDFSSRMTEILILFQDLYADPKSLRTLISRFVTRAYMTESGSTDGVRDFTAALLGTTPIFLPTKTDQQTFEPDVVPLFRSQLEFGGYEAHTWIPNYEIVHSLAFLRLIDNARHFYTIEEVGESEVLITANGTPEIHRFNFDDPSATAYSEFNFTDFRIVIEILDKLTIKFCAAGYPFDLFVTPENPLGARRLAFDSTIPLDSGETLDAPALDPGDDGWVGLTLSGRFENYELNSDPFQLALDSLFIIPAPSSGLPDCVYDGFFTQQVSTFSSEMDVDAEPDISGTLSDELDNQTLESFEVDTTVEDFSTLAEWAITGTVEGTIEASSEIAIAGSTSVKHNFPENGVSALISKTYAAPLDFSGAGGQVLYLSVYLGPNVLGLPDVENIPNHPGRLDQLIFRLTDGSSELLEWTTYKEDLRFGLNVIPVLLEHPDTSSAVFDLSNVTELSIEVLPISDDTGATSAHAGWDDLYLGRVHMLDDQASFRPARAKIELEDIDNVSPDSLFDSQLVFTDRFGTQEIFTGSPSYNTFAPVGLGASQEIENAYVPGLYKIKRTAGVGTEGFDRSVTSLNLQREIGRQLSETVKTVKIEGVETYVNVFSKQFSPTGDRKTLAFLNSNPGPDLIDITGFSGGTSGSNEALLGVLGSALAQQFTTSGAQTARFLELYLYRVGDPLGSITVALHEDDGGKPGDLIERAENVLAVDILDGTPDYTIFRLNSEVVLTAATNYWILVSGNPAYSVAEDGENHVIWAKQAGGFTNPRARTKPGLVFSGTEGFWDVEAGEHHYFKVIGSA